MGHRITAAHTLGRKPRKTESRRTHPKDRFAGQRRKMVVIERCLSQVISRNRRRLACRKYPAHFLTRQRGYKAAPHGNYHKGQPFATTRADQYVRESRPRRRLRTVQSTMNGRMFVLFGCPKHDRGTNPSSNNIRGTAAARKFYKINHISPFLV